MPGPGSIAHSKCWVWPLNEHARSGFDVSLHISGRSSCGCLRAKVPGTEPDRGSARPSVPSDVRGMSAGRPVDLSTMLDERSLDPGCDVWLMWHAVGTGSLQPLRTPFLVAQKSDCRRTL